MPLYLHDNDTNNHDFVAVQQHQYQRNVLTFTTVEHTDMAEVNLDHEDVRMLRDALNNWLEGGEL